MASKDDIFIKPRSQCVLAHCRGVMFTNLIKHLCSLTKVSSFFLNVSLSWAHICSYPTSYFYGFCKMLLLIVIIILVSIFIDSSSFFFLVKLQNILSTNLLTLRFCLRSVSPHLANIVRDFNMSSVWYAVTTMTTGNIMS